MTAVLLGVSSWAFTGSAAAEAGHVVSAPDAVVQADGLHSGEDDAGWQ
ncbi:hypothetical protein ACFYZ8_26895 [Streptomyces sp. NPDC001668]